MMSSKEIKESVMRGYFPHTDLCGHDGKPCKKAECRFFIGEKLCWDKIFDEMVCEAFGYNDYNHIKDEKGNYIRGVEHIHWHLHSSNFVDGEWKNEGPMMAEVSICFSSYRLAEGMKDKFPIFKTWEIGSRCEDGGDDHTLELTFEVHPSRKEELQKFLDEIKALIPQLVEYEKEFNVCHRCREHVENMDTFGENKLPLCWVCVRELVENSYAEIKK